MTSQHREIERKFDVPASFSVPDLASVDGVAAVEGPEERLLEAVYHDTPDLRLARARVTLRRRTGGPDAGWHVKLPASGDARQELHRPAGRAAGTPPRAVLAPVLGLVRNAPVGPVARLATRRLVSELLDAGGRVLAEVADDTVTGTALDPGPGGSATVSSWREVEVELVDGDEELLDAVTRRLLEAGATRSASASKLGRVLADRLPAEEEPAEPTAPGEASGQPGKSGKSGKKAGNGKKAGTRNGPDAATVVLAAVGTQLRALQAADLLVRTGDPEGVHDVRVACRRLRSILASFRTVLDRGHTDPLRAELRWLGGALSAARDGQVALAHLRQLVAAQPAELVLGPVAARLQQAEVREDAAGRKAADRALSGARYLALLDALHELRADPPLTPQAAEPAPGVLTDAVRRSGRRLRRALERAREHPPGGVAASDALHEVRKATKRVRYTAEVAAPVLGDGAAALVDCAKEVQEVLGARQDTVITRDRCRTIGLAAAAAGENAWTYGRLHGLEEGRAAAAEQAFHRLQPALGTALQKARRGS